MVMTVYVFMYLEHISAIVVVIGVKVEYDRHHVEKGFHSCWNDRFFCSLVNNPLIS